MSIFVSAYAVLIIQVVNASVESDFFGSSDVVNFVDGQTTATAVLLLTNDAVPEGNETFIVDITGKSIYIYACLPCTCFM